MHKWLLYGAYGFTGQLIVAEATARGLRPVLAGRNARKLQALAAKYDLEWQAFGLDDVDQLRNMVAPFDLVLHAAGPFMVTSEPMVQACLAGGAHYLDITGEIPVFETTLSYADHAREEGVVLVSGVGFDIVPTDCLARYVAAQLPEATLLETAVASNFRASAGTTKTLLEMLTTMPQGSMVRRNGRLIPYPLGQGRMVVRFSDRIAREVVPIPWGDLATAQTTTGIHNVTSYLALPLPPGASQMMPVLTRLLQIDPMRRLLKSLVDRTVRGPDETMRHTARSYLWARVQDDAGHTVEAWLESLEIYQFTAVSAVLAVEKVLETQPAGALTPALALGTDFVLEIDGTERFDRLPVAVEA